MQETTGVYRRFAITLSAHHESKRVYCRKIYKKEIKKKRLKMSIILLQLYLRTMKEG